jgi:DNA-binding transcriptional regulator YiaG
VKPRSAEWTPGRIQALRHALGESTTAFGARVARSRRAVEEWEQGRREPDALVLREFDDIIRRRKSLDMGEYA